MLKVTLARQAAAELVGTFAMMFVGCGAIIVSERLPHAVVPGGAPVAFGLAVATMIYAVGHVSGAHFNPAVTLAFAVSRHFPWRHVGPYWLAQFAGALAAMTVLAALLPDGAQWGTSALRVAPWQGLVWEAVLSFLLMFVIVAVATDTKAIGLMAGAAIGAAVTMAAMVGGPVTGAAINPARHLAPAVFAGDFSHAWLYVLGPALGTTSAAWFYERIRSR